MAALTRSRLQPELKMTMELREAICKVDRLVTADDRNEALQIREYLLIVREECICRGHRKAVRICDQALEYMDALVSTYDRSG